MPDDNFRIIGVAPNQVDIEVLDPKEFKSESGESLRIGSFLRIFDNDGLSVIAVVRSYRIRQDPAADAGQEVRPTFVVEAQPVGYLSNEGEFCRGGHQIAIPPTRVEPAGRDELAAIFGEATGPSSLVIGGHVQNEEIPVPLDGDAFFGRHVGIVGSTGSGKSCTVAKILQEATAAPEPGKEGGSLNNSHIVIFDLHGEYRTAFPDARHIHIENLKLPYWLMTAEELEEIFIESDERTSHNQISQFRYAVQTNKVRHNDRPNVSYDSPVYFSIEEVYRYICNMNIEVIDREGGDNQPKLSDGTLVGERTDRYFDGLLKFASPSTKKGEKASNGPFRGDFDRFVLRLRNLLDSSRLAFLFRPRKQGGEEEYKTEDMEELISTLIGYGKGQQNVTLIDLKGIPFEVHSLVVSLISRIVFDVGAALRAMNPEATKDGEIAFLVVYEEAHKYVPGSGLSRYRAVSRSVERIAKEGRKYGVALMIVSQRPSEISETVFSQCNSFVVMRLTNPVDQNYVRRLLPDALVGVTDSLPALAKRQALLVGEAVQVPAIIEVGEVTDRPSSQDIDILQEWRKPWLDLPFTEVLKALRSL